MPISANAQLTVVRGLVSQQLEHAHPAGWEIRHLPRKCTGSTAQKYKSEQTYSFHFLHPRGTCQTEN